MGASFFGVQGGGTFFCFPGDNFSLKRDEFDQHCSTVIFYFCKMCHKHLTLHHSSALLAVLGTAYPPTAAVVERRATSYECCGGRKSAQLDEINLDLGSVKITFVAILACQRQRNKQRAHRRLIRRKTSSGWTVDNKERVNCLGSVCFNQMQKNFFALFDLFVNFCAWRCV